MIYKSAKSTWLVNKFCRGCLLTHTLRKQVCETDEKRSPCLHGRVAKLATATLIIGLSLGAAEADQAGGQFGFSYPNFTGAAGAMTAQQFVGRFSGAMHNPNLYRSWIVQGRDIRRFNPAGVYLKHLNLRTINSTQKEPSVEGHPDYDWIHRNHPEWILHDVNGKTVPLFGITSLECLDFGNDAYLDWVLNTWMPNNYLDSTDSDLNKITYYLQDNGNFLRQYINCAANDAICQKYNTDAGVQTAWKHMLDRFKAKWPNKRILINTGPLSYKTPAQQLPWMEDVLSHSDGYYGETLTNYLAYWDNQPTSDKRNALNATMKLADWLYANHKYFFPNLGMTAAAVPQAQMDHAWAFFNLMRNGGYQFFSNNTKDASGAWQPRIYPEMNLPLGLALENRVAISPNVYRRKFQHAVAYVNLSDISTSIALPAGAWKNSLGRTIKSPLVLGSFSGLTVYQ